MNEKIVEVLKIVLDQLDGCFSPEGERGTINIPIDNYYYATGILECLLTLFEGSK